MTWQQITAAYMRALVIMVTVYVASVSNNKRIDDLRTDLNKRIDDLRADFTSLRADLTSLRADSTSLHADLTSLRAEIRDGFRKVEERFEHPITRP